MAQKLRNKNQRSTTTSAADGLDKQDPLDLETLNSEPKGKGKSKKSRLQERQEREKLLQQHRQHQQENLKRQREQKNVQKLPPTTEPNQHTQLEQQASNSTTKTHPDVLNETHQPGTEAHDPMKKSPVPDHGSLNKNDEGHGALGDTISQNVKSNFQRCTNCCGRHQFPDRKKSQHSDRCSERFEPTEGIESRNGADQCLLDHINAENKDLEQKRKGCRCCTGRKDDIPDGKTASSHPSEADKAAYSQVWTSEVTRSVQQVENSKNEDEIRLRGGCGGCGGGRSPACCPCGGCGGAACAPNTNCENRPPAGCCGGNQSRGLPCRCRCKSCSNPSPPCGTCGGQNCGKWNSCAGSGSGKCCFPRNTRRHNGADCCGGGTGGCGSCGGCC